jgi:NAD-dependent SIR2 family protein deacetylase
MRRYEYDKDICDGWQSYPIRLTTESLTECHKQPAVLVQSMEGGFVTANCWKCEKSIYLSEYEFKRLPVMVSCPECKNIMISKMVDKNYCFVCEDCELYIRLADLLPRWGDLK